MAHGERTLFGPTPGPMNMTATFQCRCIHVDVICMVQCTRGMLGVSTNDGDMMPKGTEMDMAKQARTDTVWTVIDTETLSVDHKVAYDMYKAAYKAMKEARTVFEDEMQSAVELPVGKRLVFGYNFGKLSVAVVDDDRKAAPKANAPQSLSSYLAGMTQKGR